MACPYFKEEYVGFCTAMRTPCVPSIAKMEQHCFKLYVQCRAFRNDACSTPAKPDASLEGPEKRRGPRCSV